MTSEEYEKWAKDNNIFISKVIKRLVFGRSGIYILNAHKFNFFPRFYGAFRKYWVECGFSWFGYIIEFQYNR